jgi:hypothetical protein
MQIGMRQIRDEPAWLARAAWLASLCPAFAQDDLRQPEGQALLSYAARALEQQDLWEPA